MTAVKATSLQVNYFKEKVKVVHFVHWAVNLCSREFSLNSKWIKIFVLTISKNKTFLFFFFFSRNFFTKRTKELKPAVQSAPGWKLFGKVPPRENLPKDSKIIQQVSGHCMTLGRKLVRINAQVLQLCCCFLHIAATWP